MTFLLPDLTWIDGALQPDLTIELDGGAISAIRPRKSTDSGETPHVLMPACTDIQVNGSGGVMLNSEPTAEGLAAIVAAQRQVGTGWVMPTLITTDLETMRRGISATEEAWGLEGLLGLHIEGPYLNPKRKGTHDLSYIRPFDPELIDFLKPVTGKGIPVMVTLAPEMTGLEPVRALREIGAVVSAGHTEATAEQTREAISNGISNFTHLYNAMPQMESRRPGVIAAAINSDCTAGIIADGHHVSWDMLVIACRARPAARRMFAVSDAMSTIGGPDHFTLYGERIEVKDGKLVNAAGSLAGAHVTLLECLRNLIVHVGLTPAEAVDMCTDIPNEVMGVTPPRLMAGRPLSEIVALDSDWRRIDSQV